MALRRGIRLRRRTDPRKPVQGGHMAMLTQVVIIQVRDSHRFYSRWILTNDCVWVRPRGIHRVQASSPGFTTSNCWSRYPRRCPYCQWRSSLGGHGIPQQYTGLLIRKTMGESRGLGSLVTLFPFEHNWAVCIQRIFHVDFILPASYSPCQFIGLYFDSAWASVYELSVWPLYLW